MDVRLASFRRVDPASIKDRAMIEMGAPSGTPGEALVRTTRVKPRSLRGLDRSGAGVLRWCVEQSSCVRLMGSIASVRTGVQIVGTECKPGGTPSVAV